MITADDATKAVDVIRQLKHAAIALNWAKDAQASFCNLASIIRDIEDNQIPEHALQPIYAACRAVVVDHYATQVAQHKHALRLLDVEMTEDIIAGWVREQVEKERRWAEERAAKKAAELARVAALEKAALEKEKQAAKETMPKIG